MSDIIHGRLNLCSERPNMDIKLPVFVSSPCENASAEIIYSNNNVGCVYSPYLRPRISNDILAVEVVDPFFSFFDYDILFI